MILSLWSHYAINVGVKYREENAKVIVTLRKHFISRKTNSRKMHFLLFGTKKEIIFYEKKKNKQICCFVVVFSTQDHSLFVKDLGLMNENKHFFEIWAIQIITDTFFAPFCIFFPKLTGFISFLLWNTKQPESEAYFKYVQLNSVVTNGFLGQIGRFTT
jgi:hypothetical protein